MGGREDGDKSITRSSTTKYSEKRTVSKYARYVPIMIDPLLAGDRNPMTEHRIIKKAQIISCIPVPTMTYVESKFKVRVSKGKCRVK